MTVLFLSTSGQMGGAETSLLALLDSLKDGRPKFKLVLILGESGPLEEAAVTLGVRVLLLPLPPSVSVLGRGTPLVAFRSFHAYRTFAAIYRYRTCLLNLICAVRPDVVHSNGLKMHIMSASFSRRVLGSGCMRLCHLHDSLMMRPVARWLFRMLSPQFDCVVANSESVAQEINNLCGRKCAVIRVYNGISLRKFSPIGPKLDLDKLCRLEAPIARTVRVGIVASFARWKGHTTFMRALAILPPGLHVRAYVIGEAIYSNEEVQYSLEELRFEARRLCPECNLGFSGIVLNIEDAYRTLDIVVHASTEPEPFGMVLIEAMACSKPVIATEGGGASEVVVHGKNGLLYQPGDAVALAAHIERLVADPVLRDYLGEGGRATVTAGFQSSSCASRFALIYDQLMVRARSSPRPKRFR